MSTFTFDGLDVHLPRALDRQVRRIARDRRLTPQRLLDAELALDDSLDRKFKIADAALRAHKGFDPMPPDPLEALKFWAWTAFYQAEEADNADGSWRFKDNYLACIDFFPIEGEAPKKPTATPKPRPRRRGRF